MIKREIQCSHNLPISQCDEHYPQFLAETTVGDVLDADKADGKSQAWRDAADRLIEALARENKFIVADMVQIFLESAGYGLMDYSPLGGVFKRAAKKGIISRIVRPTKQALWLSKIYRSNNEVLECIVCHNQTTKTEAATRNFNTGLCGKCGGKLESINYEH